MPTAICASCNTVIHWRNKRGCTKPSTCQCGGKIVAAVYTDEGYKPTADSRGKGKGRSKVTCALCGRKRMAPSANVRTLADGFRFTDYQRRYYGEEAVSRVTPEQPLCWLHVERDS